MNCPSRVDPEAVPNGWNQNPDPLALDTNADSNGIVNRRHQRDHHLSCDLVQDSGYLAGIGHELACVESKQGVAVNTATNWAGGVLSPCPALPGRMDDGCSSHRGRRSKLEVIVQRSRQVLWKFAKFIGPGFMVAVAYIDPGKGSI